MERAASPLDSSFAEDDSDDTSMASVMTSDDASSIVDDDHFPPPRRPHPAPLLTPLLEKAATVEGATRRRSTASGSKTTDTTSVHEDEYGVEEVCRKCNGPGATLNGRLLACFVALGAGTVVTWDATYVSEFYFGEILGNKVLANLGLAQNVSALAAMGLFMWLRGSKGVQAYAVTIGAALALMFTYAVCISVVVALNVDLPAGALYFLVVCNGIGTGISQAQLGALTGLFAGGRADGLARIGSAFGAVIPAVIQVAMVFTGLSMPQNMADIRSRARTQLLVVFGVAILVLGTAIVGLQLVVRTPSYRRQLILESSDLKSSRANKAAGKAKVRRRMGFIWVCASSAFISYAISLFLLSLAPSVPAVPADSPGTFWHTQLATILIAVYTLTDLLGRVAAKPVHHFLPRWFIVLFVLLRFALVAAVMLFIQKPYVQSNAYVIGLFAIIGFTNGALVNSLAGRAQMLCSFPASHPCPVVSTLMWLSMQLGLVSGVLLSYTHQ